MIEITLETSDCIFGGLTWDNATCEGVATIGGIGVGALLGGWAGAGVGGFAGSWVGDNFCPAQ